MTLHISISDPVRETTKNKKKTILWNTAQTIINEHLCLLFYLFLLVFIINKQNILLNCEKCAKNRPTNVLRMQVIVGGAF